MSNDLLPEDAPRWAVITCHKRQTKDEISRKVPKQITHHELLFGGKVQSKRTGESGLDSLREMAGFLNRKGMLPRPAVQCLADQPGSIESNLRKQSKRADQLGFTRTNRVPNETDHSEEPSA